MLKIMLVVVLIAFANGSSIHLPVRPNRRGVPSVNFTMDGFNFTLPMTLKFTDQSEVGLQNTRDAIVRLHTRDNGQRLAMIDPEIYFHGGFGPESILTIQKGRWIRRNFGEIAYTGNELVLNSSRNEFLETCQEGSNMTVALDGSDRADIIRDGSIGTTDGRFYYTNIDYHLRSITDRMIASVPRELLFHIEEELIRYGATVVPPIDSVIGRPQTIVVPCTRNMTESLPNISFGLGSGGGQVMLSPEDYLELVEERNECFLKLRDPAPASVGGQFFFNPLMINGLNFRISNDLLEICDSNTM